jgi:GNAT superfamily N-acetyltransferase
VSASSARAADTDLTIIPLTPDRLDDLATLFDQPGDPKWCWCASFHIRGSVKRRPPAANRAILTQITSRGPAPGLMAYRDGRVVAWVSLGPRESFLKLASEKVFPRVDDRPVWSIVCFVVDRRHRGQGIASALLDAAIDYARGHGAAAIEAYPIDPGNERIPTPIAYAGTRRMFERAGFSVAGERLRGATRWPRPIVRLQL